MLELIGYFWNICRLKQGPQDAPNSVWVLKVTVLLYMTVSILLAHLSSDWPSSMLQVAVEVATVLFFCLVVLTYTGQFNRFWKTAIALFGSESMISFFALPVFNVLVTGQASDFFYILVLVLVFWHWLVTGHIVRHALDTGLMTGLGIAFLYIYASFKLMTFLFV